MSEIFVEPEEIKAIEEVVEPPKPKEKKVKKQHISDERKAELKIIRVEALKRGREAKKLKRDLEAKAKADNQETKKEEAKPLLPIKEIVEEESEKPKKEKVEKKPRGYKSINNSEVELLKKDKKIKELEHENETRTIKQEIISWKNENRLLKEQLEKLKKEKPVKEETKVVLREKKVEFQEKPKPKIELPLKEKKKFHSRRVFGF
tara:strand:- start:24 stop:638 length:615 start_codon:yes stop_codon:yes gene_type:complete